MQWLICTVLIIVANAVAALTMVMLAIAVREWVGTDDDLWPLWFLIGLIGVVMSWLFCHWVTCLSPRQGSARARAKPR